MDDPDRPDDDASAAEIAVWMERDSRRAVAKGIANAGDEDSRAAREFGCYPPLEPSFPTS